jgi:hypothetical protein
MALADIQQLMTRLVTDPGLRARFLSDPQEVKASQGWSEDAIHVLAAVPARQLRHYGEALVHKRCRAVASCLRLTHRVLGADRFARLFRAHAAGFWPRGPGRHRDDAIAFVERIREVMAEESSVPAWAADIAAYEAAALRARDPRRRWVVLWARYRWEDLVGASRSGEIGCNLARRPPLNVWFRSSRTAPLRGFRLSFPGFRKRSGVMPVETSTRAIHDSSQAAEPGNEVAPGSAR